VGRQSYTLFVINLRRTLSDANSLLVLLGVKHALIGGFALAVYGYHRATADIDLLAEGGKKSEIKQAFLGQGYLLEYESSEVLQFSGLGFVDILLANRPLSKEMLNRSLRNEDLGIYVLKPEDIIGLKIQAYKNDPSRELQDKSDIQQLLKLANIDLKQIQIYAELFGEWNEIQRIKEKNES
jgi:hypothetical protein